ncbi:MAG: hypothetical protein M9918_17480 [Anaerolineae bacterium]|nr:hypothetical protein [Anaerolineae bacterium]
MYFNSHSPIRRVVPLFLVVILAGVMVTLTITTVSAETEVLPPCNMAQAITAHGWRTMPAGDATAVWDDINAHLNIANIGSSGQDGVCIQTPPSRGLRHTFTAPIPIIGAGSYDVNAEAQSCSTAARASIDLVRTSATSANIFADGFESGDTSYVGIVYDGDVVKGSFAASGSGNNVLIASLTGQDGLIMLSEIHTGNYLKDTFEKEEWLLVFDGPITVAGGSETVVGDQILIYPEQNQLREICGGRLTFDDHDGIADNITIDSSAIQRGELWHGTPNNTPVTGASVDGFFDIIPGIAALGVMNTDVLGWTGCLTCTFSAMDAEFVHTFDAPLRLLSSSDEIVISSIMFETLLSHLDITRAANGKPQLCPLFPTQSADVDIQILRDGEIILFRTLAPGDCLRLPKQISVISLTSKALCNNEVIQGVFRIQGSPTPLEFKMGPQSCDSSTFAPTDVQVGYSRAFSVEISGVNAGTR